MRRVLFFILLAFIPYLAYGAYDTSKYNTAEADAVVSKVKSDRNFMMTRDTQEIRDFINNEDPEFINDISNLGEYAQRAKMREWLAKKSFIYFYNKYMSELKTQSDKTGRAIKTEIYSYEDKIGEERVYWLDRGQLDKKECKEDALKRHACDYPDGFEEYSISHTIVHVGSDYTEILVINKDDISADTTVFLDITLHSIFVGGPVGKTYNVSIDATANTEKYTDRQRYRNQEAADIRAGKYRKPTKEERKKYSTNTRKLRSVMDDSREWKSNELFPDAAVMSFFMDYESNQ